VTEPRRFHDGDRFDLPPHQYRLRLGRKGPGDLVLEWRWVTDWRPVELDHVALILDAISDNENVLYPPPAAGGGKVWAFVRTVFKCGWVQARHDLHLERMRRDERTPPMTIRREGVKP
jgi:hypothetical protein